MDPEREEADGDCQEPDDETCDEASLQAQEALATRLEAEIAQLRPRIKTISEALVATRGTAAIYSSEKRAQGYSYERSHSEIMADLLLRPLPALLAAAPTLATAAPAPSPALVKKSSQDESCKTPTPWQQTSRFQLVSSNRADRADRDTVNDAEDAAPAAALAAPAATAASSAPASIQRRSGAAASDEVEKLRRLVTELGEERTEKGREVVRLEEDGARTARKLEVEVFALKAERTTENDVAVRLLEAHRAEHRLETQMQHLESNCIELDGRLRDAQTLESNYADDEERILEIERAEQTAMRLQSKVDALEAACEDRGNSLLDAQRAYQRSVWQGEDVEERLQRAATASQRLSAELKDARGEVTSFAASRRQLQSQLECDESLRLNIERELQAMRLQFDDLRIKYEASSSALQLAQNHSDAMQLELRRTRLHLEEASEVAETRHRLNSELMQAKTELSELRQMCHQDQLWAMSLRQENEQLAADLRAASAYSESLSVELRGTGEKAQNSHEKCCELWVALETQRLETQRLQATLDAARRENVALSQQLRWRQANGEEPRVADGEEQAPQHGMFSACDGPRRESYAALQQQTVRPTEANGQSSASGSEPGAEQTGFDLSPPSVGQGQSASLSRLGHPSGAVGAAPRGLGRLVGAVSRARSPDEILPAGSRSRQQETAARTLSPDDSPAWGRSRSPEAGDQLQRSVAGESVARKETHVDSVSRLMRQGHFSKEMEAQRERKLAALEKQLTVLNGERQFLESSLLKFPSNTAGRTLVERRQKREAEERLEAVDRTISEVRQSLRQMHMK